MSDFCKRGFPLEFQKVEKVEKRKLPVRKGVTIEVDFYQSNQVTPQNFYKPVSKIFKFEFD